METIKKKWSKPDIINLESRETEASSITNALTDGGGSAGLYATS